MIVLVLAAGFVLLLPLESALAAEADEMDEASSTHSTSERVLWLWTSPGISAQAGKKSLFETGLEEALSGERARHVLGPAAFQDHMAQSPNVLPACLIGLEPCVSAHALAFKSLNIDLVIRLEWESDQDSEFKVRYAVLDRRGELTRHGERSGESGREVAFDLVREIFDATGNVAFDISPSGAEVEIDGQIVGAAPLEQRLSVGTYDYRVRLADHRTMEGRVEIGSASSVLIRHDLSLLPGTVHIEGAPPGATLYINEVSRGPADEAIELEPGHYTVEVRAEGYETFRDTIRVTPGDELHTNATLLAEPGFLGTVSREAVQAHRFGLRLGYESSLHVTTFRNARQVREDGREYEFRGFSQDGVAPDDEVLRRFVSPHGLRLEAYFSGEYFGLTLLSLSWLSTSLSLPAEVEIRRTGERVPMEAVGLSRLQLRPFQLTFRYFYENFVPLIDAGTGIGLQWLDVQDGEEDSMRLRQTEAFWSLGAGLQYFVTPRYSVMLRYGMQGYFNQGLGLEHTLGLSVGMGFQNVFGFEAEPPGRL
ncbi:MAG: PEGA domain-containing protein [Bradymonadaceae bacterium]